MKKRKGLSINFTLILGLALTLGVFVFVLMHASSDPWIYLNIVGLVIVVGGLSTATLVMQPWKELVLLVKRVIWLFEFKTLERIHITQAFIRLATKQSDGGLITTRDIREADHYMLKDGVELLGQGLKAEDMRKIFDMKMEEAGNKLMAQSGFLNSLSKLGPGLGLVGTLFGMVALLYQMGQGSGLEMVGPAMAIALCATLYGVTLSNMVFIPLADLMGTRGEDEQATWRLVSEGILMLKDRRHPVHVREALKAYLTPEEVSELNRVLAGGVASEEANVA